MGQPGKTRSKEEEEEVKKRGRGRRGVGCEKEGKDVTEAKSHRGVSREGILRRGSNRYKCLNQEWLGSPSA